MPILPVVVIVPPVKGAKTVMLSTVPDVVPDSIFDFNVSYVIFLVSKVSSLSEGATLTINWSEFLTVLISGYEYIIGIYFFLIRLYLIYSQISLRFYLRVT
jgi:hypothetical protein